MFRQESVLLLCWKTENCQIEMIDVIELESTPEKSDNVISKSDYDKISNMCTIKKLSKS